MRLVLHVGFPKTGTSSIQAYCSQNYEALKTNGVLYAKAGRMLWFKDRKRHIGLGMACEPLHLAPTGIMQSYGLTKPATRQRFTRKFFRRLDREISANSKAHTVLLSDEGLSAYRDCGMPQYIYDEMSARFDSVTIFCMMREPSSYLASDYSQHLKMGGTQTWSAFLEKRLSTSIFLERISCWQEIFGRENIVVRVLKEDAVEEFSQALDLPVGTKAVERQNPSLSSYGMNALRALNAEYEKRGKIRPSSVRSAFVAHLTGPGLKASVAESHMIYAACAEEIAGLITDCDLPDADVDFINEQWRPRTVEPAPADPAADDAKMAGLLATLFR